LSSFLTIYFPISSLYIRWKTGHHQKKKKYRKTVQWDKSLELGKYYYFLLFLPVGQVIIVLYLLSEYLATILCSNLQLVHQMEKWTPPTKKKKTSQPFFFLNKVTFCGMSLHKVYILKGHRLVSKKGFYHCILECTYLLSNIYRS
jgi:hypothetical protein